MDESASSTETTGGRERLVPLSGLRVFELKEELGKRGLDKTGIKVALIERLLMAIRNEGHDPETYLFSVVEYSKEAQPFTSPSHSSASMEAVPQSEQNVENEQSKDAEGIKTAIGEVSHPEDPLIGESGTDVEVRDESEDSKSMKEQELERKEAEKQELEKTGKAAGDQVKSECEGIVSTTPALIQEAESTRSCSLWVRGIGANVKASDLKTLFANCGRVVSAKIFIRRQQPTNAHIGYVTMINTSCAERCVQFFDKVSYNGNILSVRLADKLKGTQTKSSNVVAASSSGKGAETSKSNHPAAKSCFENRQTTDKKDDSFEDKVVGTGELRSKDVVEKVLNEADEGGKKIIKKEEGMEAEHDQKMEPNLIRSQDRDTGKVASAIKAEVEIHEGNEVKTKDDEQKERQRSTKTLEKEGTLSAKSGSQPQLTNALLKSNHSLWIRGIGADTKAAHLKTMFANCGRVVTAKVFVRRQKPANVYFGFIAMVNTECADECVRQFHKAILNGQQITVERADRVDMAVRIPEAKKENKASTAVMKEEGTEIAKGKEDSEKMKGGEKRSASAAKSNVEIKRQSSENGARKGLAKVKQVARRPEHSRPNTQFSSASNRNERRSARNIFRAHQRVRTMRSLPTQCAIRKPVRPLITTKPARWFQYAPSRRGRSDGRFAVPQSYGHSGGPPPFASVPPSFPSIKPVMGSLPHGNVPKPISPLMSRSRDGGGFGGYHVRNLSGGAGGPSRRDFSRSRSPLPARFGQPTVTPWEKNETAEMVRRKQEGFRLREEERHLQEERDRLRHERECIERERILLEKQQMEREQRARDEMERAHRERIAVERENAERSRAERECVARGRAERESIIVGREQQARHEKERVVQERLRIEREHDRFRMERERTGRIKAEQERRAERLRAEQERARSERLRVEQERARAERLRVEQERARAERLRVEQERAAEQRRIRTERERVEHERAAAERERLRAERERVEKELAERQRLAVERERAEKERAERERLRLERERAERERLQLERLRAESERERKRAEADRERLRTAETAKRGQAPEFGRQPDRLKTQMERMERERLELEQLRQLAALTASQVMSTFAPDARSAREGAAAHQGIGVSRHRSGTYVRPDERFAPFSAGDMIGRYSTEATAVPATSSRYEVNREREHGRHDMAYDSYGSGGSFIQSGQLDYRVTTHQPAYMHHAESQSSTAFLAGREPFGCRYDSGRREEESYASPRRSAIPDSTVQYPPQSQTSSRDTYGQLTSNTAASGGYSSGGSWSTMPASGTASNPSSVSPYAGYGGTAVGPWQHMPSSQSAQCYPSNNSNDAWPHVQQARVWGGQQQQSGSVPPFGEQQGAVAKRASELKSQVNRPGTTHRSFDEPRHREMRAQDKAKTVSNSKNVNRNRSGGTWSNISSRY